MRSKEDFLKELYELEEKNGCEAASKKIATATAAATATTASLATKKKFTLQ